MNGSPNYALEAFRVSSLTREEIVIYNTSVWLCAMMRKPEIATPLRDVLVLACRLGHIMSLLHSETVPSKKTASKLDECALVSASLK